MLFYIRSVFYHTHSILIEFFTIGGNPQHETTADTFWCSKVVSSISFYALLSFNLYRLTLSGDLKSTCTLYILPEGYHQIKLMVNLIKDS